MLASSLTILSAQHVPKIPTPMEPLPVLTVQPLVSTATQPLGTALVAMLAMS